MYEKVLHVYTCLPKIGCVRSPPPPAKQNYLSDPPPPMKKKNQDPLIHTYLLFIFITGIKTRNSIFMWQTILQLALTDEKFKLLQVFTVATGRPFEFFQLQYRYIFYRNKKI